MKFLLYLFLLPSISLAAFGELDQSSKIITTYLHNAKECIPELRNDGYHMCDGTFIDQSTLNEIMKFNLLQCKQKIMDLGHGIYDPKVKIFQKDYDDFQASTMRALVLHERKIVFFKDDARLTDCIHELLHVYQRQACGDGALCPVARKKREEDFLNELNKQIDVIATYEKEEKVDKANELAAKLKPYMKIYGEWTDAINWLDEKDVHFFIYHHCDKFGCIADDKDIALANIFKLKKYFPSRFSNYVIREASKIIYSKEKVTYSNLSAKIELPSKNDVLFFDSINQQNILAKLKKKRIGLLKTSIKPRKSDFGMIAIDFDLSSLNDIANNKELYQNLNISKFDGATHFCNHKNRSIVISKDTTYEQLLREMYFIIFSGKNPEFCSFNTKEIKMTEQFKIGKIDRNTFDSEIINIRANYRYFLDDFFSHLLIHSSLNEIQKKELYPPYFLNMFPDNAVVKERNGTINFITKNELPVVKIAGIDFVLDFGAMNSVAPIKFFSDSDLKSAKFIKSVSLNTVYGQSKEVPVIIPQSSFIVGDARFKDVSFAIHDLGLPGVYGVLGLDFFKGQDFIIYPQKGTLEFVSNLPSAKFPFALIPDFDGGISVLEFRCENEIAIRVDSGSQVEGDIGISVGKDNYMFYKKNNYFKCSSNFMIDGNFKLSSKNPVLFDRGISLNLGWPWLKKYSKIEVSLKSGKINFVK